MKSFLCVILHPFFFDNPYGLEFVLSNLLAPSYSFWYSNSARFGQWEPFIHQFTELIGLCVLWAYPNLSGFLNQLARSVGFPDWVTDQDLSMELAGVLHATKGLGKEAGFWGEKRKKKWSFFSEGKRVRNDGFKLGWQSMVHQSLM